MEQSVSSKVAASPECLDDEALVLYAVGALSESASDGVKAHIDECDPCRRLLVAVAATDAPSTERAAAVTSIHEHTTDLRRGRAAAGAEALGPFRPGEVIAEHYRIEGGLGAGGMGRVLLARDTALDRLVAVKVMHEDLLGDATAVARFAREARAVARLTGPHVPHIYEVGVLPTSMPFIVMEYLEGIDLGALTRECGRLPVARAVRYVREACEALESAHALGIVHRDVKPRNLFLAVTAGKTLIKVLDFGIAKVVEPERDDPALTRTGAIVGTAQFVSPEQIEATCEVDARSDIWSLGATLFCLLTGRPPFDAASTKLIVAKILLEKAPLLRTARPDAPAALEAVVARCLERDPADRFSTATALRDALDRASKTETPGATLRSNDSPLAAPPSPPVSSRALPWSFAAIATAALAFLAGRGNATTPATPAATTTTSATPAATTTPSATTAATTTPSATTAATTTPSGTTTSDATASTPSSASPSGQQPPSPHATAHSHCACRAAGRSLCKREDLGRTVCECRTRDGTTLSWMPHDGGALVTQYTTSGETVGSATGFLCEGRTYFRGDDGTLRSSVAQTGSFTGCRRQCAVPTSFAGIPGTACSGVDELEKEQAGVLACP